MRSGDFVLDAGTRYASMDRRGVMVRIAPVRGRTGVSMSGVWGVGGVR